MTPIEALTSLAGVFGLLASVFTAFMMYRAERAKSDAQVTVVEAGREVEQAKLLNLQAEQLRQGLLEENSRLEQRIQRLEERTRSLENENLRLRQDLADCIQGIERPLDLDGRPAERRKRT